MIPQPSNLEQLAQILAGAFARKEKIEKIGLGALNRVTEYTPEDMTVTVEAGITLAALQAELGRHGQWLPLDPPHLEQLTIGELINANASGPRRFGYGTIRDYLIGIKVALADGRIINSGGKVVKNVAGYDLAKLFIGGQGSLGVVVGATFKLRPLPEMESFVHAPCASLDQADKFIEAVINSEITPVVLDLHKLSASGTGGLTLVLGFAGTREEVEWQLAKAGELGMNKPSSLDYETKFWMDNSPAHRLSVLPSKMVAAIRGLNDAPFVARAGNGIVYHRGAPAFCTVAVGVPPAVEPGVPPGGKDVCTSKTLENSSAYPGGKMPPSTAGGTPADTGNAHGPRADELPLELMRRVKDAYDPGHILPGLPL